jgi:hypothetical protein
MTYDDDDRLRQLESDLRAFRPPPPSPIAAERLAQRLARPRPSVSDRILAATVSLAGLAACTIVGLLLTGPALTPSASPLQAITPRDIPTVANAEPLLARADLPTSH